MIVLFFFENCYVIQQYKPRIHAEFLERTFLLLGFCEA
jgi:hypothetical protein